MTVEWNNNEECEKAENEIFTGRSVEVEAAEIEMKDQPN